MRIAITLLFVFPVSPAYAQIENCDGFKAAIDNVINGQAPPDPTVTLLDPGQNARCFATYIASLNRVNSASFASFVKAFEGSRSDKQAGAAAGSGGTTSVVAQGPAAKVLSVAAEYGALTQDVNGQVITLRGNLA